MTQRKGLALDGASLARELRHTLARRIHAHYQCCGRRPSLATLLVGEDPASATYVRMKARACQEVGITFLCSRFPSEGTSTVQLLSHIDLLNQDPRISGILIQHPLPPSIQTRTCFDRITPHKDVDGVTSHGLGRLALGLPAYRSATARGIMMLLWHHKIILAGKKVSVVGRSPILGKPLAMMLTNAHATVTICHSQTKDLLTHLKEADLVVGALGRPRFLQAKWIKKGAVVIDAGYHPGGVGDTEIEEISRIARAYTPVPGGVGPMTIATLLLQTVEAFEKQNASLQSS